MIDNKVALVMLIQLFVKNIVFATLFMREREREREILKGKRGEGGRKKKRHGRCMEEHERGGKKEKGIRGLTVTVPPLGELSNHHHYNPTSLPHFSCFLLFLDSSFSLFSPFL